MPSNIDLMPVVIPGEEARAVPTPRHGDPDTDKPCVVILYNCDCHTFDDVEVQLQKATGCSLEKAEALAVEVDSKGRAIVFQGELEECERVAAVLGSIRLQVEVDRA